MNETGIAMLLILLALAAWWDVTEYRIPNLLIALGLLAGMLFRFEAGGLSALLVALQGLLVGIAVLLPLYLLRAMGAGDVKLMGVVGVFLGPVQVLGAWLVTLLIGGVLSLWLAMYSKKLTVMLANAKQAMVGVIYRCSIQPMPTLEAGPVSAGKLPYGVAIALGTSLYLLWQHVVA